MHQHRTRWRAGAVLVLWLLLSANLSSAANEGEATRAVRDANETVARLLKRKVTPGTAAEQSVAQQVVSRVRAFLDIDELGRRSLADHWQRLTADQRQEFLTVLRQLVERNYINGLRANVTYSVDYTGQKERKGFVVVSTAVKTRRNGRPFTIEIDYIVSKHESGWRAHDVVTDGIGLVENYRAQFNKIMAKEGFDGLLKRMQARLEKMSKT
jgi:phospholipid transport system substrate-binding protein